MFEKVKKGRILDSSDLNSCGKFLSAGHKMVSFMKDKDTLIPVTSQYANTIVIESELHERIIQTVIGNEIEDQVSTTLHKIRKKMKILNDYIQDSVISMRNGRHPMLGREAVPLNVLILKSKLQVLTQVVKQWRL